MYVPNSDDMDELAVCNGKDVRVDDDGVRLRARGNTSPTNPPRDCVVYLFSAYMEEDGTNKLQVVYYYRVTGFCFFSC